MAGHAGAWGDGHRFPVSGQYTDPCLLPLVSSGQRPGHKPQLSQWTSGPPRAKLVPTGFLAKGT